MPEGLTPDPDPPCAEPPSVCRCCHHRRRTVRRHGFQPRDPGARRHLQALQPRAGCGVDAPDVAFLALPGAVPKRALDQVTPVTKRSESMLRSTLPVSGST